MNFKTALLNVCAISVLTGLGYRYIGSGKYDNSIRLVTTLWIIMVLLEASACCITGRP